jgi:Peptidase inhibitor family I36
MKKARMAAVGMVAALASLTAISLLPSLGASAQAARSAKHFTAPTVRLQADRGTLVNPGAPANPAAASGQWNIYADIDLEGDCIHNNVSIGNLGECRNIDKSFWNNTNAPVRLYYGPDWESPWICFDARVKIDDLSGYWFNNGGGASNHTGVYEDVASVGVGTPGSKCSNPGENE